jgi:ribosomal protein S18 acetylase RimI-like enzyme
MKKNIRMRPPSVGDTSVIQGLLQQLGHNLTAEQTSEKIAIFAQKEGHHVVAEIDREIVGFMSLHIMEWFHRPDRVARLSAIVIDKESRRAGIGRTLMAFAEEKAIQSGCTLMEITSNVRRKTEGTYDFYASLGYMDANHQTSYFRKKLA